LSLLGTFLVRSGVLTSVHAFATDPTRGTFILVFLCVAIGGSLALYAWRAPQVSGGGRFDLLSRESFLLTNNLLLTLLAALILLGTLAPLIYEAMGWGKISVGFPWFNKMFVAITPFLAVFMGIGHLTRWKHDDPDRLLRELWLAFGLGAVAAVASAALIPLTSDVGPYVPLGLGLAVWLLVSHVQGIRDRLKHKKGINALFADLTGNGRSYYGMILAHLGVAMFIVGATMVSNFGLEKDVRMSAGDEQEVADYRFRFLGVENHRGPNYTAARGHFLVFSGDKQIAELWPEKRSYFTSQKPMTEASIDWGFTRDLYVSLGEPVGDGDWALRLYYKPFVRWIWLGALLMALGGILAITDRRYRTAPKAAKVPAGSATARG
jgi:cytochrome c-type biogenesis protein CcmF